MKSLITLSTVLAARFALLEFKFEKNSKMYFQICEKNHLFHLYHILN